MANPVQHNPLRTRADVELAAVQLLSPLLPLLSPGRAGLHLGETGASYPAAVAEMEGFARQKVTGFINNSNLLTMAGTDDLRRGYDVIKAASDMTGLPVVHTTARPEFLEEFLADGRDPKYIGEPIGLKTYMHRSWEAFTKEGF